MLLTKEQVAGICEKIAKNCGSVPQLIFAPLWLELEELGLAGKPATQPQQAPAPAATPQAGAGAAERPRPGVERLWDSQWVNIVNAPEVLAAEDAREAVHLAVKLTEARMAANFAECMASSPAPAATTQQGQEAERQAWAPYLSDRADGVKGHYAIARWNPRGYREVWNLRSHRWASASDEVLCYEEADSLLRQITIPTAQALSAQAEPQAAAEVDREELLGDAIRLLIGGRIKCSDDLPAENRPKSASARRSFSAVYGLLQPAPAPAQPPAPSKSEQARCPYCDDTGDVNSPTGEWRGRCTCAASQPPAPSQAPEQEMGAIKLREWALSKWRGEVQNRPLVNHNRRPLDDTWRQVLHFAGVGPEEMVELIGPRHDELLATQPPAPRQAPAVLSEAEAYRWLRDTNDCPLQVVDGEGNLYCGEGLDATVRAAMQQKGGA